MSLLKRLGMSLASFGLACAFNLEARLYAKDIYVPQDYATIQSAIDANDTVDGDRVLVAPGEYVIDGPITYRGKNIILKSVKGPENTIINGNNQIRIFTFNSRETKDAILEGFTITKGDAYKGGAICCEESSPTIRYNIITGNEAYFGGGIACVEADPLIISNVISNNIGGGMGGGVYCEDSQALILDNIIKENLVWDTDGGGIYCEYNSSVIVRGNYIINNFVYEDGGGISLRGSHAIIENNIIARNLTYEDGGGISGWYSRAYIIGNTIVNNSTHHNGGGIDSFENHEIILLNNIIYANTPTDLSGIQLSQVHYCNISQEGFAGTNNNIYADPLFVNPDPNSNTIDNFIENGDFDGAMQYLKACYHLKSQAGRYEPNNKTWVIDKETSPCIDAGDPMSPIGLEPFPNGGRINMGAFGGTIEASKSYFGEPVCETIVAGDINGDCIVNFKDFALMALHWLRDENQ